MIFAHKQVGDALAEDADWSDWLATVMRLLHGYPMRLQLPLDKNGKPDFMDAWWVATSSKPCNNNKHTVSRTVAACICSPASLGQTGNARPRCLWSAAALSVLEPPSTC